MAIVIDCPSCTRKLRVPDEMLGKKVKCPQCGTTFMAAANGEPEPEEPAPRRSSSVRERPSPEGRRPAVPDEDEDRPRRRPRDEPEDDEDYKRPARRSGRRAGQAPHRGTMVLVFGIISIVLFALGLIAALVVGPLALILFIPGVGLGIPAWAMGGKDVRRIDTGHMDPEGRGSTMAGYVMGIVGTILNGLSTFCCVLGFILALAGIAALAGLSADMQKKNQRPPGRFEQQGSPLRFQDYLPGVRR